MIFGERRKRMRSNGMHAENEQEYLQKIIESEAQQRKVIDIDIQQGTFIENSDFTFEPIGSQPILIPTSYKNHLILLMVDDFFMSAKRLFSLLETSIYAFIFAADNFDTMTISTNEDTQPLSSNVWDLDCFIHCVNVGDVCHQFQIWIQNTKCINEFFKQCYYPLFESIVMVKTKGKSYDLKNELNQIVELNQNIKCFTISEEDEQTEDKIDSLQKVLKQLI